MNSEFFVFILVSVALLSVSVFGIFLFGRRFEVTTLHSVVAFQSRQRTFSHTHTQMLYIIIFVYDIWITGLGKFVAARLIFRSATDFDVENKADKKKIRETFAKQQNK